MLQADRLAQVSREQRGLLSQRRIWEIVSIELIEQLNLDLPDQPHGLSDQEVTTRRCHDVYPPGF